MHNVITLILGGGRGSRLYPLTKYRSKPAVPLGGKYRLIDVPLSNCINSGLNRIYVLTQFLSVSLHRHIRQTYRFDRFTGGFVGLLAAQQTIDAGTDWYEGTADAVRKNLRYIRQPRVEHVLILSGDQLYRMDYREMIRTHARAGADVTIAAMPVARDAARSLGVMRADDAGRVVGFLEKPQTDREIELVRTEPAWIDAHGLESRGRDCLASMGIYLFNRDTLVDALTKTDYQDFGREVFPASIRSRHVQVHLFDGYWEDVGTIRTFYEANLGLIGPESPFPLTSPESPVFTRARSLPPSTIEKAAISQSLIADGCHIGPGAVIENSVVGLRAVIGRDAVVRDTVLMGADEYQTADELADDRAAGRPHVGIGRGAVIEKAIIDKNCRIGRNVRIVPHAGVEESAGDDAAHCVVRDGIPVVVKGSTLPDGWEL